MAEVKKNTSGYFTYDGVDWDFEGNDNLNASTNVMGRWELDTIVEFSKLLKGKSNIEPGAKDDPYIVSIVPPESYFDVSLMTPEKLKN